MDKSEEEPKFAETSKSSNEILTELFSTFDAEPPLIIKKEDYSKKSKKSKKKHKHKDKKHKHKKVKKRKRSLSSSSSDSDNLKSDSKLELVKVLVKEEVPEKKIKLEANDVNESEKESNNINIKNEKDCTEESSHNKSSISSDSVNVTEDKKPICTLDDQNKSTEVPKTVNKIKIPKLNFTTLFKETILDIQKKQQSDDLSSDVKLSDDDFMLSDGEIKESTKKHKHKQKHSSSSEHKRERHKSQSKDGHSFRSSSDSKRSHHSEERYSDKREESSKHDKYQKYSDKSDFYTRSDDYRERKSHRDRYSLDREREKSKYYEYSRHKRDDSKYYKEDDFWDKSYREDSLKNDVRRSDKRFSKDRDKNYSEHERIDKKKLLEIARRNAIQMMRSGSLPAALTLGPQAQEKVLAAIRAGGKTIEELTDFCKTLSKKEELGELSSVSEDDNDSDNEKLFHHPFQIKEKPTSIVMNIKNSVPLPTKTSQERTTELRMQFPVSSGQQHRKTENEWVPVSPKKTETVAPVVTPVVIPPKPVLEIVPAAVVAPPPKPVEEPPIQVFPAASQIQVDIGAIVSQRLSAMRKLQENPNDVQAIGQMYKAQKEMQSWAESKQQPGQFTGSTGAQILSQAELNSGYQAWAKKDQLQNAAPVSGGMGMHLLQKMGWKPGEGLGREKSGALEPLLLEVKLDKKGLVAGDDKKKRSVQKIPVKTLEGKHPVSLLGEYAAKKKLGPPTYELCDETGPDHKKTFLFKVILNGVEYKPSVPNFNKKQAKKDAAEVCLQYLGLLPSS